MERTHFLPKASSGATVAPAGEQAHSNDDVPERVVLPFPMAADIIGTPLRSIPDEHLARLHGDIEQARAIRARKAVVKPQPDVSWKDAIWLVIGAVLALLVIAAVYP